MSGTVSEREAKILGIIETARGKRAKFRDERITMAHGAGGKATQGLIEGSARPGVRRWTRAGRRGAASRRLRADDRLVRRHAAPLPRRLDRRARRQRHGQRPRRAQAPARSPSRCRYPRGGAGRRGRCRPRSRRSPAPPAPPACASWPATPRSSSAATPTGCTSHDGLGAVDPARSLAARSVEPGDRILLRAGSATTAWRSCWRAASSSSRPTIESDTPLAVAGGRRAARRRAARRCAACATPPAAASPRCSTSSRAPPSVAMIVREAAVPVHPAVAGAARAARHRPDVRRQRGQARRVRRRPRPPTRRSPRCGRRRRRRGGRDRRGPHRAGRHGAGGDRRSAASG